VYLPIISVIYNKDTVITKQFYHQQTLHQVITLKHSNMHHKFHSDICFHQNYVVTRMQPFLQLKSSNRFCLSDVQ